MTTVVDIIVSETSYGSTARQVVAWAQSNESRYICIANVHVLMEAHDSMDYRQVINQADMVTPDGMPLVWMLQLKGAKEQTRVYGPTLMLHVLEMAEAEGLPVGFFGADEVTLERLMSRMRVSFPRLNIAYAYSPPFRTLEMSEEAEISAGMKASGARIMFVGLGCPKQETWMAGQRGRLPMVMLGVGAAFDFHSGVKRQSPPWLQDLGLEWFYRLVQEPRRLWRRYLYNNPRFVFLAIMDLVGLYR